MSIFDVDQNFDKIIETLRDDVAKFIQQNYKGSFELSELPNSNGKFQASSSSDIVVSNKNIKKLTDGRFIWTNVDGCFDCSGCYELVSLEGSPKVAGDYKCGGCKEITTLEGAPDIVKNDFTCNECSLLKSL